MYRGYNISLHDDAMEDYFADGIDDHALVKNRVSSAITSFQNSDGSLDAARLTAEWFPEIDRHVFISHAHKDSDLAIRLAGFLKYEFEITSFIDSAAWGYAEDLLRLIDDTYCLQPSGSYNYSKRNRSTSHVHMMLSTALAGMIDRCDCVMFLNTPSSIAVGSYVNDRSTESPWIYSEIAMTRLIGKRKPAENRLLEKAEARADDALRIRYEVNLDHLTSISTTDLNKWRRRTPKPTGPAALEALYAIT